MKIKKEFIIIGGIILALLIYLLINFNNRGDINYKLPKLNKVLEKDIDKIEYSSQDRSIILTRDKTKKIWRVSPEEYPVDEDVMNSILGDLSGLILSELISEKKIYDKYDLHEAGRISVKAYAGGKEVRNLDIGKVSSSGHSFIKLDGNPEVYSVKTNIRTEYDKSLDDIRDKTVLAIDKNTIRQIVIENEGETITLNRTISPATGDDAGKTEWRIPGQEKPATQRDVDEILNNVTNLVCDSYIPEDTEVDLTNPEFTITFIADKTYTLKALGRQDDNMHPAISSENDYPVYLIGWKMTRMMKNLNDFTEE